MKKYPIVKVPIKINEKFYEHITDPRRFQIFFGGAGSGKSVYIAQQMIFRAITSRDEKIYCYRSTQPSVKDSVFALIKKLLQQYKLSNLYKINKTNLTFEFKNGSMILCKGLDDPEKIKSVDGVTCIWVEEANQIKEKDMLQLNLRLRGHTKLPKQIFISFNPVSKNNYLYKLFFKQERSDCNIVHSTFRDNHFIDPTYKKQLEDLALYDQNFSDIYLNGKWGTLEGVVFQNYKMVDDFPAKLKPDDISYGVDFGYSAETALVECREYKGQLYFKELLYEKKLSEDDLVAKIKEKCMIYHDDYALEVFCDSADPRTIDRLYMEGINAHSVDKGPGSILSGIRFLKRREFFIIRSSKNLIKELNGYVWKTDKNGNPLDIAAGIDHAIDAVRYSINNGKIKSYGANIEVIT